MALERSIRLLDHLARLDTTGAALLAARDLRGILRERIRTGETDDDVTVIERVWECRASEACIAAGPVRIERETRILEDLGKTRRRSVTGKRAGYVDTRARHDRPGSPAGERRA